MNWSSDQFYKGQLVADSLVAKHDLKDLCQSEQMLGDDSLSEPLCLIDTDGCDMAELTVDTNDSKGNTGSPNLRPITVLSFFIVLIV